ncbi:MAG TPA: hypothetical protein VFN49_07915 [Candidatus Aquilonibacter sp.]|nr:hypothetical protein [Candidatus Aquilonibacter sp.]
MALAQPAYTPQAKPRIPNPRTARNATHKRIRQSQRSRYGALVRVGAVLTLVLVGLMSYVMLTSNVTSLTYAVSKAHRERDHLQAQTARLDDKISSASSDERLAAIARKLQMTDPQAFAVVKLPPVHVASTKFPVLDSIAGWFSGTPRAQAH